MNAKSISRMLKANATTLDERLLQAGAKRLKGLGCPELEFSCDSGEDEEGFSYFRLYLWHQQYGFKLIARRGLTMEEARAKVGLSIPYKAWNMKPANRKFV